MFSVIKDVLNPFNWFRAIANIASVCAIILFCIYIYRVDYIQTTIDKSKNLVADAVPTKIKEKIKTVEVNLGFRKKKWTLLGLPSMFRKSLKSAPNIILGNISSIAERITLMTVGKVFDLLLNPVAIVLVIIYCGWKIRNSQNERKEGRKKREIEEKEKKYLNSERRRLHRMTVKDSSSSDDDQPTVKNRREPAFKKSRLYHDPKHSKK
jgi:hypothetical protein